MNVKKYKKWLIVSIVISATSLAIIFMLSYTKQAGSIILSLNPLIILYAITLNVLAWTFWAIRIKILASALDMGICLRKAFRIVMVSQFMAAVTPSSMGGEPMRIYMLSQDNMTWGNTSVGDATALTVGERLIDFLFFGISLPILLLLVGLSIDLAGVKYFMIASAVLLGLAGLFTMFLVTHPHRFKKKIHKLDKILRFIIKEDAKRWNTLKKMEKEFVTFSESTITIFKRKKLHFVAAMGATALMWTCGFTIPSVLLMGFGQDPMWLISYTFQMIIVLITMIPVSPGGSGLAEFSAYFLYGQRVPSEFLGPLIVVWRILTFYMNLGVGLVFTLHYIAKGK